MTIDADRASEYLAGKRVVIVEDRGITLVQLRKTLTRAGLVVVGTGFGGGRTSGPVLSSWRSA